MKIKNNQKSRTKAVYERRKFVYEGQKKLYMKDRSSI